MMTAVLFEENKQEVCNKLADLLKTTHYWNDVDRIDYNSKTEYAIVYFRKCEPVCVNVAMDSGKAIISDILKAIS